MALTCRIELSKTKGVTVFVEDAQNNTTQTVVLDGTSIVLTSKDQQNTSTIKQTADAIEVKCKSFTVDAETVTVKSSKDSEWQSQQKLSLSSQQDMALASQAKLTADAQSDMALSGATVAAKGQQKASLAATQVAIEGQSQVDVMATKVAIAADLSLDVKGTVVKVASDGTLEMNGQVSTLKGQITNVQGTMIKLG
jgi:hypothetical protein